MNRLLDAGARINWSKAIKFDDNIKGIIEKHEVKTKIKKIKKNWQDLLKPYKGTYQIKQEIIQALLGIPHLFLGIRQVLNGAFSRNGHNFKKGMLSVVQGISESIMLPLAFTAKPILRGLRTLFNFGWKKVERNENILRLIAEGNQKMVTLSSNPTQLNNSMEIIWKKLKSKHLSQVRKGGKTNITLHNEPATPNYTELFQSYTSQIIRLKKKNASNECRTYPLDKTR